VTDRYLGSCWRPGEISVVYIYADVQLETGLIRVVYSFTPEKFVLAKLPTEELSLQRLPTSITQ
jgi:hypothetical protein